MGVEEADADIGEETDRVQAVRTRGTYELPMLQNCLVEEDLNIHHNNRRHLRLKGYE